MKFIVEGRRFSKRLHAITYARDVAYDQGRSVDVKVETTDFLYRKQRSWVCRLHPGYTKATALKRAEVIPHVRAVAV